MSKLDIADRERAIIKYLTSVGSSGASIKDIHATVSDQIGDTVTRPAYYKILDRLSAAGKLEVLREDPERGRLYGITPTLQVGNAITLDDVYEMLPYVATTEALARAVDAQDYYEENRQITIRRAAEALIDEDPVELFHCMIMEMVEMVRKDLEILRHRNDAGEAEIADSYARNRLVIDYRDLEQVAYRGLSLPHEAVRLPGLHQIELGYSVECDQEALREALKRRIFGDTFIREVDVSANRGAPARKELVVSGSDASMHAGTLALRSAGGFIEDSTEIITFNNSVGYVRLSAQSSMTEGRTGMVHSAPFTRQTLDDPAYKGMVLAPFMFPDLSEAEYTFMSHCATDVVQFRVDEEVFAGKARDLTPPHSQIPRPQVHFRDGTIAPQEREFRHYERPDQYGEMVREGIGRERSILERIIVGGSRAPVFAGAVKSTQMRLFSRMLNWYIARGSRRRFGSPIQQNWEISRAAGITDNAAMTMLLASLPNRGSEGKFYVTCALLRQFPSLTEFYDKDLGSETWLSFFQRKKEAALNENRQYGGALPYHATVDLDDDDFIFMCERADFLSFYIGHTDGDPPPMIPRYEFLASLRHLTDGADPDGYGKAARHVNDTVIRVVDAIDRGRVALDRDHNFLSGKTLVKVLPYPVQQAHEYSKTLGRKLEAELKSIVVSRLIALKRLRADPSDIIVRPVSVRRYLERLVRALESRGEDRRENPR